MTERRKGRLLKGRLPTAGRQRAVLRTRGANTLVVGYADAPARRSGAYLLPFSSVQYN